MQPHRLPRNLFAGLATITHSPRGLLCVRKSRAIRNGHEGPPRRSLFGASLPRVLPDRARCSARHDSASEIDRRCLGERGTPFGQREEGREKGGGGGRERKILVECCILISSRDKSATILPVSDDRKRYVTLTDVVDCLTTHVRISINN